MAERTKSILDFRVIEGDLQFQLSWETTLIRLWPLALFPVVVWFICCGPGHVAFPHDATLPGIIVAGLAGQLLFVAWVLRDRLQPFVVDTKAGLLRRGKQKICALSDIYGVKVIVRSGKNNAYIVSVERRDGSPCRLFTLITATSGRSAAAELAQQLNVPILPNSPESG